MAEKPASQITDRAKRYRAQRNQPHGPKRCNFCWTRENIDIDHISGDESDAEPENLFYLCRSCNTRKGVQQARNRIGIRTRQYNPRRRRSLKAYRNAAMVLIGIEPGDVAEATEIVRSTPPEIRPAYAQAMSQLNPINQLNPPVPTFAQYAHGISIHRRGAIDEGGAIIHATPPAVRSRYARQIARIKAERKGS